MADTQVDIKQLIEKLTSYKFLFLYAFVLILAVFGLYNLIVKSQAEKGLSRLEDLNSEYIHFEDNVSDLHQNLNNAYKNVLQYYLEEKELYRYQAISAIGDANGDFNEMSRFIQQKETRHNSKIVELHQQLQSYEAQLLQKLNKDNAIPQLEFEPLIIGNDTTTVNLSTVGSSNGEEATFEAENKLLKSLENQLFELQTLVTGNYNKSNREDVKGSIYSSGLFWVFAVLFLLILIGLYILVQQRLTKNIHEAGQSLQQVSMGVLPEQISNHKEEFGEVFSNTNAIIDYFNQVSDFAKKIGEGDFEYEFNTKSENDTLGNALIQMRSRLQEVAREDKVRNWMNEGHARLGDILRASSNEFEKLGDNIVAFLVDYLDASMGALYILNEGEGEPSLELLSAFAFNRKKHEERKLKPGEGLAGQAFIERKSIFLKEVKTEHFNIVTGLGESKPASIFIVPLKHEESIEGVVELASFRVFEDYEKEFIEKLGETVAAAIKGGKDNETTKRLLAESQQKEEEMKAQEEELRQNMEELSATQEQVDRLRKEDESKKKELEERRAMLYEVLNQVPEEVFLKDEQGKYVYVNKPFALAQNRLVEDFIDKTDFDILTQEVAEQNKLREKQVMESGESMTDKIEGLTPEGKKVEKQLRLSEFYINYLQSNGILGITHTPDN